MTFLENYQQDALRTEAPLHEAVNRLSQTKMLRINHAVLGLISDLHELAHATDDTNTREEVGDLFWFLNLGMSTLERPNETGARASNKTLNGKAVSDPSDFLKMLAPHYKQDTLQLCHTQEGTIKFMMGEACQLADVVKAAIHYGKAQFDPPPESIHSLGKQSFEWMVEYRLKNITAALSYLCLIHLKVAPHTIMEDNIRKLRARFPDAYSQAKALERDKDAERAAINSDPKSYASGPNAPHASFEGRPEPSPGGFITG
jgi:hypothetical protein